MTLTQKSYIIDAALYRIYAILHVNHSEYVTSKASNTNIAKQVGLLWNKISPTVLALMYNAKLEIYFLPCAVINNKDDIVQRNV